MKHLEFHHLESFVWIVLFSFVVQMSFAFFTLWIFLKSRNKAFFTLIFMTITFLPMGIWMLSWLNLINPNTFLGESLKNFLGTNLINQLAENWWIYHLFFSLVGAIPWIAFHALNAYFWIRSIPNALYDMAKMDGLNEAKIFSKVIYPLGGKGIFISLFVGLIAVLRFYESFHMFTIVWPELSQTSYRGWENRVFEEESVFLEPNALRFLWLGFVFVLIYYLSEIGLTVKRINRKLRGLR